jgi:hypothetical protein
MANNQIGTGVVGAYVPSGNISLSASGLIGNWSSFGPAVLSDTSQQQAVKELIHYINSEEYINHVFDEELINICNMAISTDTNTSSVGFDLLAKLDTKRYLYVQFMFSKIINLAEITNFHTRNFFKLLFAVNANTYFLHILYHTDEVIKIVNTNFYQHVDQIKGTKELENVIRYSNLHTYFGKTNIDLKNISLLID